MNYLNSNQEPLEQFVEQQYQNENLLRKFPVQLHEELIGEFLKKSQNRLGDRQKMQRLQNKVSCLITHMLDNIKSKKQGLELVKNIQFLNNSKGSKCNKDTIKTIAKLKMTKSHLQKQQILSICHALAMDILMGAKNTS